jgi:hypothetical protein
MNLETRYAYRWLSQAPAAESCNRIVREVYGDAQTYDQVYEISHRIHAGVMAAFPRVVRADEPSDFREMMRAGLARVDWVQIALLFIEQEEWRKRQRKLKARRTLARNKRKK